MSLGIGYLGSFRSFSGEAFQESQVWTEQVLIRRKEIDPVILLRLCDIPQVEANVSLEFPREGEALLVKGIPHYEPSPRRLSGSMVDFDLN